MEGNLNKIKVKEIKISPCDVKEIRKFIEKNHYSHNINGVKITQCFKAEYKNILIGAVLFGKMSTTAWRKFSNKEEDVIELRRLVLVDEAEKNSESYVIGWCIRYIKKNFKNIKIIVSYADPYYNHVGTIYKASNFKYIGLSNKDKGYLDIETKKIYHSRALRTKYKGDYKPFVKELRNKLKNNLLIPIILPQKHCYIFNLYK